MAAELVAGFSAAVAALQPPRDAGPSAADYVGKYREFKYQETLFELYARQFELARADESREGGLIQVVDPATPPEKTSKPKRAITAIATTLASLLALLAFVLVRYSLRRSRPDGGAGLKA